MEPHAVSWRESLRVFSEAQFIHPSVSGENNALTASTLAPTSFGSLLLRAL